jgi:uncharacterized membrane protein
METTRLRPLVKMLGDALWVRPAIAVVGGLAGGLGLGGLDGLGDHALLFSADADAARDVLNNIIVATLTVTATVFGFIIVALQVASTQFSPRSLRTFVRDRGTQTSLAIFMGVVAYAIGVLLRTSDGDPQAPALAMTVAVALIAAVVSTLAFLIHHTAQSIRIEHLMESITRDTLAAVARVEQGRPEAAGAVPDTPAHARSVAAAASGYLQEVERDELVGAGALADVVVALEVAVGDHVIECLPVARVWRRDGTAPDDALLAEVADRVSRALTIGYERTMHEDVAFGPRQLVDIALRAISPAVNDPRTAIEATTHLARILCALSSLPLGDEVHRHDDGSPAVVVRRLDFADHLSLATDQIRRFGSGDAAVYAAQLVVLGQLGLCGLGPDRTAEALRHVDLVEEAAMLGVAQAEDRAAVQTQAERVRRILRGDGTGRGLTRGARGAR